MSVVQVRELRAERTHHVIELWHEHSLYHGAVDFFQLRAGFVLAVTATSVGAFRSRESFHYRGGPLERGLLGYVEIRNRAWRHGRGACHLNFIDRIVSSEEPRPRDAARWPVDRLCQDEREIARLEPDSIWVGRVRIWAGRV